MRFLLVNPPHPAIGSRIPRENLRKRLPAPTLNGSSSAAIFGIDVERCAYP